MPQRLFVCPNCGKDTLTHQHAQNCLRQIQEEENERKRKELGIGFRPEEFHIPNRLNPG